MGSSGLLSIEMELSQVTHLFSMSCSPSTASPPPRLPNQDEVTQLCGIRVTTILSRPAGGLEDTASVTRP